VVNPEQKRFTQAMLKKLHIGTSSIYKTQEVLPIMQLNLTQELQVNLLSGDHQDICSLPGQDE
jgi:hypothetical protein